ncbi:hypothetical protein OG921_14760 [Aldersonia sp. NBC_00410]|uniref:hypothetical protein n=1 Tax=Aldersonia sp. NBC_00410 TaxID=2975954 RepID=UPI00224D7F5B|nr:hypothetical protein [Aldersonia sp. NBC_00410]MCX5044429.1 hypothetical protein [Aldersonia sp. NBC_00410]
MTAAVVTSFDEPPHYPDFDIPQPHCADEVDAVKIAAAMKPAMSSWLALRRRVAIRELRHAIGGRSRRRLEWFAGEKRSRA